MLARRCPVPVRLDVRVEGRLPEQVEIATYFAVAEMLTNTAKHAQATAVTVDVVLDVDVDAEVLRVRVSDDGRGGADIDRGSGLRGVSRRLAAFDGTLRVTSPPGGPTDVRMEIPCEPLSPRITPSFERA